MTIDVTLFTKELDRPSWEVAQHLTSLGVEFRERRFSKAESALDQLALLLEMRSYVLGPNVSTSLLPVLVIDCDAVCGGNMSEVDRLLDRYQPFLNIERGDSQTAAAGYLAGRVPSQPNYLALSEAMKIYIDSMRSFIMEHMTKFYGSDGTAARLKKYIGQEGQEDYEQDKRSGREGTKYRRSRDVIDYADPKQFVDIIGQHIDAFKETFVDQRGWSPALDAVRDARNSWAHPCSGDMDMKETSHALKIIQKALDTAKLYKEANLIHEIDQLLDYSKLSSGK